MRMLMVILMANLLISSPSGAVPSTNADGSLQAIAQGPTSIAVYWRHGGQPHSLYMDGKLLGEYQPNPSHAFACQVVPNLTPNTCYTFSLNDSVPAVSEKTWSEVPRSAQFDVLVLGGTGSGVAAAIGAAKMGLNVALVEETNRLGGMSVNSLGASDVRTLPTLSGLFFDFGQRVNKFYGVDPVGRPRFESRVSHAIIKEMVYEQPRVTVFMKSAACGAIVSDNRVLGADIRDLQNGKCGRICAPVVIDATDTADFARSAGAQFRFGREARSEREPHAGVIYFDDKTQKILPGSTGAADHKTQSYAYLMIWKDYGEAGAPLIEKPRGYDPETYRHSPEWEKTWGFLHGKLPNNKHEINQHPFGGDWPGVNFDYPTGTPEKRREIEALYRDRALGYLYFMQNERGHKNLGLADDEFPDNCNFTLGLYVREAGRLVGEDTVFEDEVTKAREYHRVNSIGIAEYPMDSHAMEDLKDPSRKDKGEGEMYLSTFTPWSQVPYGVVVPCGVDGLLVTTAVSATHVAIGTLRLEPIRMTLGQAAAAAAYWSLIYDIPLRSVNPAWIQDKLLAQDSYINWNSDVNADTRHFRAINFLGAKGIFENIEFRPEAPISRQEAAAALEKMLWFETHGRGAERVKAIPAISQPGDPLTRGQFAVMLAEAKRKVDPAWNCAPAAPPSYSDVPANSPYFVAVETLTAHRISAMLFADAEPGKFRPDAPLSRADAAQAIYLAHRPSAMGQWKPGP